MHWPQQKSTLSSELGFTSPIQRPNISKYWFLIQQMISRDTELNADTVQCFWCLYYGLGVLSSSPFPPSPSPPSVRTWPDVPGSAADIWCHWGVTVTVSLAGVWDWETQLWLWVTEPWKPVAAGLYTSEWFRQTICITSVSVLSSLLLVSTSFNYILSFPLHKGLRQTVVDHFHSCIWQLGEGFLTVVTVGQKSI